MLILRRRVGEALLLGDGIEIQVLEIGPSRVKLGIRAPDDLAVIRKEVAATRDQNRSAAAGAPPVVIEALVRRLTQ
jgi:carbon storage regulator